MYYVLFYHTIEDYIEKRAPYRTEHLRLATEARQRGELVMAGALDEPADSALLVFKANSPTVAENFAKNDPYVIHGLIANWQVRPWNVVIQAE